MMRSLKTVLFCSVLFCEAGALAQPLPANVSRAVEAVQRAFPGARCFEDRGKIAAVFGVPMEAPGKTPVEAVETWFGVYGDVFGDPRPHIEFLPMARLSPKGGMERAVVGGVQFVDGRRVSGAVIRALCVKRGDSWSPAYIALKIADEPWGGLGEPQVGSAGAVAIASGHAAASKLNSWGEPTLEVRFDDLSTPRMPARLTWSVVGRVQEGLPSIEDRVFRVDAVTGEVWRIDEAFVRFADITGTVTGWATPGTRPDGGCSTPSPNDPVEMALPLLKVTALSGSTPVATTFTDANGDYTLGTSAGTYTVRMELIGPNWEVKDASVFPPAPGLSLEFNSVSNGSTRDGEFNDEPSENPTAQVNAHLNVARARTFFLSRIYAEEEWLEGFDTLLLVLPNVPVTPWGSYDPQSDSISFGRACCTYANFAYSTIIAHEYAHFVGHRAYEVDVDDNGSWHEGFADCVSHLLFDTRIIAEEYAGCGTYIRDPENPVTAFPSCSNGLHDRGMVLSGSFWDIREAIGISTTQQLFVDWAALATGDRPDGGGCSPSKPQSADALTLEQVLIADDDDGDLSNGTPHLAEICDAFENHNITSGHCGESSSNAGIPDWDRSGSVNALDLMGFFTALQWTDHRADANGDGTLDVFDPALYLSEYERSVRARR